MCAASSDDAQTTAASPIIPLSYLRCCKRTVHHRTGSRWQCLEFFLQYCVATVVVDVCGNTVQENNVNMLLPNEMQQSAQGGHCDADGFGGRCEAPRVGTQAGRGSAGTKPLPRIYLLSAPA